MMEKAVKVMFLALVTGLFSGILALGVMADEQPEPRNASSRMGFCAPGAGYGSTSNQFVNLMYSRQTGGISGPDGQCPDGWPLGEIPEGSMDHRRLIMLHGEESVAAPGEYHEADRQRRQFMWRSLVQEDVPLDATGVREFTFHVYWEGDGDVELHDRDGAGEHGPIGDVLFEGPNMGTEDEPDHRGPFSDGPRDMKSRTWTAQRCVNDSASLSVHVTRSNPEDPVKNIMILMPGFDESNYEPIMANPAWVEKSSVYSVQRFFSGSFGRTARSRAYDTGEPFEQRYEERTHEEHATIREPRWEHPVEEGRMQGGYGAWSRPTHASFALSPRAAIELCNALSADIWWSHPYLAVRDDESQPEFDADGNRTRGFWVDREYIEGYTALINDYLAPGLRVFSEWTNESWGGWSINSYGAGRLWGIHCFYRTKYNPPGYGDGPGDGRAASAFDMLASAKLARNIRAGLDDGRELIATCNMQEAVGRTANVALALIHATEHGRELLEELDAIGLAPYRSWPGGWQEITGLTRQQMEEGPRPPHARFPDDESQWIRIAPWPLEDHPRWQPGTTPGPGKGYMTTQDMADYWNSLGADRPWDDPQSWWNDLGEERQRNTRWRSTQWKLLAIDALPERHDRDEFNFSRLVFEGGRFRRLADDAPPRWDLKLVAYESGQHNTLRDFYQYPLRRFRDLQYHPDYRIWHESYYGAMFSPGPRRNEDGTISKDAEPLYYVVNNLSNIRRHSAASWWGSGMWWGVLEYVTQPTEEQPRYQAMVNLAEQGVGMPEWWLEDEDDDDENQN